MLNDYPTSLNIHDPWQRSAAGGLALNGFVSSDTHRPASELRLVAEVAVSLLERVDEIAYRMANRLHSEIPELAGARSAPLIEETRASCRANVGQLVRGMARAEPVEDLVTPPEAIEYARSYVHRQLSLAVLMRAYRLGQAYFLEQWTTAMSMRGPDAELGEAIVASTAWVFAYIDGVCNQLEVEYRAARERWARTPDAIRADTARKIISGTFHDEHDAGRLLGHELSRRHHLAAVIWGSWENDTGDEHALERAAASAGEALGLRNPLVVQPGGSEVWVWFSSLKPFETGPATALRELEWPSGVRLAVGRVQVGFHGFRSSHLEARGAARVAVLAGDAAPALTSYDDVELVSLLSADLERARAFVTYELGALAGSDPSIARLRETMLVLLQEGMSNSRAANRLYVHHNTVVYRTARAHELLGHRLVERRSQVTAALMLAQTLGHVVLPTDDR